MTTPGVPLSILDLVQVAEGTTTRTALHQSVELAQLADALGYHRYWYAAHHNVLTFASSATSLLIGRAAEHTRRIRLGSGGVMLPNHSPLMVAEYYGTLAEMHGDRVDLGPGRASKVRTARPRAVPSCRQGSPAAPVWRAPVYPSRRDQRTPAHLRSGRHPAARHWQAV
jgi:luciferase family oxidoreductase group 1